MAMAEADAAAALSARSKVQAFLEAARAGDLQSLKSLAAALDEDGTGAASVAAAVRDANKRTALHFAAREGRTDVCEFLVGELGLPVDPKDDDGETPLIHATRQGHLDTAKYLLDRGADPSVATTLGATALHHAAGIGNTELMKLLLSKGVDVESESDAGTPLVWAAGHGNPDAVKLLLQHDAKPNTEYALEDAKACRALRPDWAKACYREGAAHRQLQRFEDAANAFYEGVQLDPENKELVSAFREAVEAGRKAHGLGTARSTQ